VGWQAYESVLVIEHAVGLDPRFLGAFEAAVRKLHAHLKRSSTTQINQTKEKFESSPSSE
jgi:hypothetical protein